MRRADRRKNSTEPQKWPKKTRQKVPKFDQIWHFLGSIFAIFGPPQNPIFWGFSGGFWTGFRAISRRPTPSVRNEPRIFVPKIAGEVVLKHTASRIMFLRVVSKKKTALLSG